MESDTPINAHKMVGNVKVQYLVNPAPGQISCIDPSLQQLIDRFKEIKASLDDAHIKGQHIKWLVVHNDLMCFIDTLWELYPDRAYHIFQGR